jgi:hypothetical protein
MYINRSVEKRAVVLKKKLQRYLQLLGGEQLREYQHQTQFFGVSESTLEHNA